MISEMFEQDEMEDEILTSQWIMDVYHMKIKSEFKTLAKCIEQLKDQIPDYKYHISIKTTQTSCFKESIALSCGETVVIQIDFAENFKCVSQNEIQSGYILINQRLLFSPLLSGHDFKEFRMFT